MLTFCTGYKNVSFACAACDDHMLNVETADKRQNEIKSQNHQNTIKMINK